MWNSIRRINSSESSVCKFVYEKDNAVAESVLYAYPNYETRTVICCSTQSGCPVGCRFCGAGDYFARNLTTDEIVSQVVYSIEQTNVDPNSIKRLQVMFMSMGEPMLNYKNLSPALYKLKEMYPNIVLLISTIGPNVSYEQLFNDSVEIPSIGLQFSVHKSTDVERNKLIPFKAKMTLAEIANMGNEWHIKTGRKPFFNYCAADDNTSDEDVQNLYKLFDPKIWECTISVICERNEGLPTRNDYQKSLADEFSSKMLNAGYNVRVFDPAGQNDVGGGCGQLFHVQRWMKNNPDKIQRSVGFGLPIIHCPSA